MSDAGAGPAGIATALALSEHKDSVGNPLFSITIFEQKSAVGGRMVLDFDQNQNPHPSTPFWHGLEIEDIATSELLPAASIIRARFEELGNTAEKVSNGNGNGFKKSASERQGKSSVGFFNGKEIIAQTTRPGHSISWSEWFALVFRYGSSVWKAKHLGDETDKMVAEILKAGSLPQNQHRPSHFPHQRANRKQQTNLTLHSVLATTQLSGLISQSAEDFLAEKGISSAYINEILNPQIWRQIAQDVNEISEVALHSALGKEYARSIGNGLYGVGSFGTVMKSLAGRSGADIRLGREVIGMRREVIGMRRRRGEGEIRGGWEIESKNAGRLGGEMSVESFDQVVIAAPWNISALLAAFGPGSGRGPERDNDQKNEVFYRRVYVTFIVSNDILDAKYFGFSSPLPDEILFTTKEDGNKNNNRRLCQKERDLKGIYEISHVRRMYGPDFDLQAFHMVPESGVEGENISTDAVYHLYRILSDHPLDTRPSADFLKRIFGNGGAVVAVKSVLVRDAYPLLWPRSEREVGELRIAEGLSWTGAVDGVGSGIELAWVVGEVVAGCLEREMHEGIEGGGAGWRNGGDVVRPVHGGS